MSIAMHSHIMQFLRLHVKILSLYANALITLRVMNYVSTTIVAMIYFTHVLQNKI